MNYLQRERIVAALSAAIILGFWILVLFALTGCAGSRMLREAHDAGGALGVATEHCAAYGPLKTTKASKGTPPKIKFGAAIVCEK